MSAFLNSAGRLFYDVIFIYALAIMAYYTALAFLSALEIKKYLRRNRHVHYKDVLSSPHVPSVSIVVPVFNDAALAIDRVRQLLSLHYSNFDVIIVNDGSWDSTLRKLVTYFGFERVEYALERGLPTKSIRAVYKSPNPAFKKLTLLEKIHGGRCDALNTGVNFSDRDLILCADINCTLDPDALLKMVKPFMEGKDNIIASSAAVRHAGPLESLNERSPGLPHGLIPKFHLLKALRTSLLQKMAQSRNNSLLGLSTGLSLFEKKTLTNCGGFMQDCTNGNTELAMRLKRYVMDKNLPSRIVFVPDPICWSQPPATIKGGRENYLTEVRGKAEGLRRQQDLFFNSSYKALSLGYFLLFLRSRVKPIIEGLFVLAFIALASFGKLDWEFSAILLFALYLFSVTASVLAVLFEELSFGYASNFNIFKIVTAAALEPILYYPLRLFWSLTSGLGKRTPKDAGATESTPSYQEEKKLINPEMFVHNEI